MKKSRYSDSLTGPPFVDDALRSCSPLILRAADVSRGALDPSHPTGGFCTFISGGRVDQSQPITASIDAACELTLVHQDEVEGQTQLVRMESVAETYPTGVSRRSPGPVFAHPILTALGINRPDVQVIQRSSRFTSVFNLC